MITLNKKLGKKGIYFLCGFAALGMITLFSCSDKERIQKAQNIDISEIMASNRTGLLTPDGKPKDWIELKNNSTDSINLKGFELAVVSMVDPAKENKKKKKKNKDVESSEEEFVSDDNSASEEDGASGANELKEQVLKWEFPDTIIGAGKSLVVFADKGKSADQPNTLSADFTLPKEGATIQFLAPNGDVIKEVKYGRLSADQSYALQDDKTYAATNWQSPGYDNTREGYEAFIEKLDSERNSPLKIWEVMSRAENSTDNWVELKNVSDKEIDLAGYALQKKPGKKQPSWALPSKKLQPGEIITVQLAGNSNPNNPLAASIKLGSAETIILSKDGKFVDGVCAKLTKPGGSIGRINGKKGFYFFSQPSRNQENPEGGKRFIAAMPVFDKKPGIYSKDKKIALRLKDVKKKVHYTLDGSVPTMASPLFKDSIVITENTIVRAFTEGDDQSQPSRIATMTFLPGAQHDLAVMSVTLKDSDLYDYNTGIYADGPGYTAEWPHQGANYWKDWTKNAHVEFFDGKEGFSTDCGLKIFGGFSRSEAKKSFRLKFRGVYGEKEVIYDFFGNGKSIGLKDLVLRSGSQDYNRCMVRDEFFTSLMKAQSPNILVQEYRPVALYVNGKYFGLYYLREKIDNDFVARKLNLPSNDSVNIIMSVGNNERGPKAPYMDLMNYIKTHDMSNQANFEYVKSNVDLEGLIDYKLGEIYSGNTDVGNIRYVRSTTPESDRKWHFVFYDLDATWTGDKPTADHYLSTSPATGNMYVTEQNVMINRLLANKEFRQLFLQRLSHHLHNTFTPQNTTAVFDNLVAKIRPEMKLNAKRWPQLSYEQWEKNTEQFKKKFATKNKLMLQQIREYIKITPEENKKYFGDLGY